MKKLLTYLLVLGICLTNPGLVLAAEDEIPSFDLNQVVVTALRTEKTDLNTPAAVTVLTKEDLTNTGAKNIIEALQFSGGITYSSQGPAGQSRGGMNSQAILRGFKGGTLVLLNGVSLNIDGKYRLEDIPIESVEKIEIVKGSSSSLYGSEAFGGVINIITKKKFSPTNAIALEKGSFGYEKKKATYQNDKFSLTYLEEEAGARDRISLNDKDSSYFRFGGSKGKNLFTTYHLSDNLSINYIHGEKDYSFSKMKDGASPSWQNSYLYNDKKDNLSLVYDNQEEKVKMTAFWNEMQNNYDTLDITPSKNKRNKNNYSNKGLDLQKSYQLNEKANLLIGGVYKLEDATTREYSLSDVLSKDNDLERKQYALYGQYSYQANPKLTFILGGRQELIKQTMDAKDIKTPSKSFGKQDDYSVFCPQFQTIYKVNDTTSYYTNIGRSFGLPSANQLMGSAMIVANPDLKPENGWTYEVGFKNIQADSSWKVALYSMDIKDRIGSVKEADGKIYSRNAFSFKNEGIEIDYKKKLNNQWSYSAGGSYSNPRELVQNTDTKVTEWQKVNARLQLNGGVHYNSKKLDSSLVFNYLGQRAEDFPDNLSVNLNCIYKINDNNRVTLAIDNPLDRETISTHGSSKYLRLPRNYRLAWETKF